jgi:hypothetical protein
MFNLPTGETMKSHLTLTLLVCIALAGCSGGRELERSMISSGYDFTPYTAKGFFISPEQYLLPYDPIGVIRINVFPEVKKHEPFTAFDAAKYTLIRGVGHEWLVENVNVPTVINEAYRLASKMGGDGIVRFSVDMKPSSNGEITYPTYEVSGFAIKRK